MDDAGVKTVFEKDTCKMVGEALVLMQGFRIGTLYSCKVALLLMGATVPQFL